VADVRRRRAKRVLTAAVVAAVALGAGIGIARGLASGSTGYHTAAATIGDARETLEVSGTAQPAQEVEASFQVAGTVTAVSVAVGQHVGAGQTVATLDTTSLQNAVTVAQTSLDSAQAALAENEAGQAAGGGSSAAAQTTAASSAEVSAVLDAAASPGGSTSLQQAQQAVVTAQHSADVDIQTAQNDAQNAASACAGAGSSTTSTSTTTTPSTTTTTTPSSDGGSGSTSACTTALEQELAAENQVSVDQGNLSTAESALGQLLSTTSQAGGSSSTSEPTSGANPNGDKSSGAGGSSSNNGSQQSSSAAVNSSQQLASDQAAIDSDEATMIEAQQNLAAAQLTSPLSGTVASIAITVGQNVSAGSTNDAITIISPDEYEATASLSSSQVGEVSVGDTAQATFDGTVGAIEGTVSRVGPVQANSGSYTYPVIIALDTSGEAIAAGSATTISVDLAHADHTLVVPTSAVHTTSVGDSYVDVFQDGKVTQKRVDVGIVGGTYTQIISGIAAGTRIVLADLSQSVPSSSTNSITSGNFFRGAGLGAGSTGFPGGNFQVPTSP
jgi:RND family efflux transporter MFP subunit